MGYSRHVGSLEFVVSFEARHGPWTYCMPRTYYVTNPHSDIFAVVCVQKILGQILHNLLYTSTLYRILYSAQYIAVQYSVLYTVLYVQYHTYYVCTLRSLWCHIINMYVVHIIQYCMYCILHMLYTYIWHHVVHESLWSLQYLEY